MNSPVRVTREPIDVVIEEIRVAMTRKRWTQRDLARELEVNEHWVYRRLSKAADISVVDLFRIAEALGVKARDLIPEGEPVWEAPRDVVSRPPSYPIGRSAPRRALRLSGPIAA
jgi:transcriptional regulator with XRE-family HTH domain